MNPPVRFLMRLAALAVFLLVSMPAALRAQPVFSFPFNEGPGGMTVTDSVQQITGYLGTVIVTNEIDKVGLVNDSPTGLVGDRSFTNSGKGFLLADTGTDPVLNITNGPITIEAWIKINSAVAGNTEGIVAYGGSYKMGFKAGVLVFTLFGKVDITNSYQNLLPADSWVHVATVWEPGVGVTFYVDQTPYFVANTNTTARVLQNTRLSLGNEGVSNPLIAGFDRIRIHKALLTADQIDAVAATPKPLLPTTLVSYDFNEADFPCSSSLTPALPAIPGAQQLPFITGPVWTNGSPQDASGGSGLYFDGTKRLVVPDPNQLINLAGSTTSNYTLEAWVKLPLGFEPTVRMILFTYEVSPGFALSINTGRTLHTTTYGFNDINSAAVVPNDNQWHHVAAILDNTGDRVLFYIDGVLLSAVPYTRGPGVRTTFQLTVGAASNGANGFTGFLDRIRFSSGILTPAEFDLTNPPAENTALGDIASGLKLHLKLDETNGTTVADSSPSGLAGTLVNYQGFDTNWLASRVGGGLFLPNTNVGTLKRRIIVADTNALLNFPTNSARTSSVVTVAAWIKLPNGQTNSGGIITKASAAAGGESYCLDVLSGGIVRFFVRDAAGVAVSPDVRSLGNNTNTINDTWLHVVGVSDGSNPTNGLKLYLNGLLAAQANAPRTLLDRTTSEVAIGTRTFPNYNEPIFGLIDDVRIYDRALSAQDVKTLYLAADFPYVELKNLGGGAGVLSWPAWIGDYVPQGTGALLPANTDWQNLSGTPATEGYFKTLPVNLGPDNKFFRVRKAP